MSTYSVLKYHAMVMIELLFTRNLGHVSHDYGYRVIIAIHYINAQIFFETRKFFGMKTICRNFFLANSKYEIE